MRLPTLIALNIAFTLAGQNKRLRFQREIPLPDELAGYDREDGTFYVSKKGSKMT